MKKIVIKPTITSSDEDSLSIYLHEIYNLNLISAEEEVELFEKIKQKDEKAFEKLIKSNLRFVITVAKQYQNQGLSLSDLISEGNIGLIKAAERFDATRGFKFISYAVWWIKQSILKALSENSRMIRLPQNKILISSKINKAYNLLFQKFQREPTVEEIAEETGLNPDIIKIFMERNEKPNSIDTTLNENDDFSLEDVLACEESFYCENDEDNLIDFLNSLSEFEKEIIRMYYGIDYNHRYTLEEIAEHFNTTKEHIRNVKNKIIDKLKKRFN